MGKKLRIAFLVVSIAAIFSGVTLIGSSKVTTISHHVESSPASVSPSPFVLGDETTATFKVTKVIDGDTIEVDYFGKEEKVRYVGVDTPETVDPHRPVGCFGKEASNENKQLVEGKEVELIKDVSETDKFGRLLRYVYLKLGNGDMLFVNDYLVREGYAKLDTIPPDVAQAERFKLAEEEARLNNRGLWSANTCGGKTK